jgi:hypothetical protein
MKSSWLFVLEEPAHVCGHVHNGRRETLSFLFGAQPRFRRYSRLKLRGTLPARCLNIGQERRIND